MHGNHVYLDRWGGGDSYFTPVDPTDPNIIYYEHQSGRIRRNAGLNRVVWDLTHKDDDSDAFVPPGKYVVEVQAGDSKLEGNVVVTGSQH